MLHASFRTITEREGLDPADGGQVLRPDQHGRGRHDHRLLGREGALGLLASGHRNPAGRRRRQRSDDGRRDLGADAPSAPVSGPHVRLQLLQRSADARSAAVLRLPPHGLHDHQPGHGRDEGVRPSSATCTPTRSRPESCRASTSDRPTSRPPSSARTSPTGSAATSSDRRGSTQASSTAISSRR